MLRPAILLLMETNSSEFVPENVKSEKSYRRFKEYTLIHGLVPSATAPFVNTLQEKPILLSTQTNLSNIKSKLS